MAAQDLPTTQRAYTLRLQGRDRQDQAWRQALWATHEAVNQGAKAFGDWLLTLRGGLDHRLADDPVTVKGKSPRRPTEAERRIRRIMLALSWLAVESGRDAPSKFIVPHQHDKSNGRRHAWQTVQALRGILLERGLGADEIDSWAKDCDPSLSAQIRADAVWVNRRAVFDGFSQAHRCTQDDVWDFLGPFFGSKTEYLSLPLKLAIEEKEEKAETGTKPSKDLVQKAGQWLSSRFGEGQGADFAAIGERCKRIGDWAETYRGGGPGDAALTALADYLGLSDSSLAAVLKTISGPGYKSATRNWLKKVAAKAAVTDDELHKLKDSARDDAGACAAKTGRKGPRPYSDAILQDVEQACGFPYRRKNAAALHSEFAVMLDQAARRVSGAHSWIKNAEVRRQQSEEDASKITQVPSDARTWLDSYCREQRLATGTEGEYCIRRRALGDSRGAAWRAVVKAWQSPSCTTREERIAAARGLQDDPELDKFGDIRLFEALAADNAKPVWQPGHEVLCNYAAATEADHDRRRFKVPAYRHPDPLGHPVFVDFGNSRWQIRFAIHQQRQPKKKKPDEWIRDDHALRLGLWTGAAMQDDLDLRWQSKLLTHDLGVGSPVGTAGVSRADRLGRAAAGTGDQAVSIAGLFEEAHWNGRLQAPRKQLDELAQRIEQHGWDERARGMRDRLDWLLTFSAPLVPHGPWPLLARERGLSENPKYWPHSRENRNRGGMSRLVLSRLPGLRLLSVDLGHRYAAACAVWQTVTKDGIDTACREAGQQPPGADAMYLRLQSAADGKKRTWVHRRIGPDKWVNIQTGEISPNPAPWARLDRQFTVKLQGEERAARAATGAEREQAQQFLHALGCNPDEKLPIAVDALRVAALRIARLGLRRHGVRARIAFNLTTDKRLLPGGREETLEEASRHELLADALLEWHRLAADAGWKDERAQGLWKEHIEPLPCGFKIEAHPLAEGETETRAQQKTREQALIERLLLIARELAKRDLMKLHIAWAQRWRADDQQWREHLRWLRDWLMPRAARADMRRIRRVGGLSLPRIASLKSLYQLEKAYRMRPEPEDLRKNIPREGDDSLDQFGKRILDALEHLREQRIKQLASRIAEAALGIGNSQKRILHQRAGGRPVWRLPKRLMQPPSDPRFAPCHAVVIENLERYRPEEVRTRRENRQLMEWSSGKVFKYLGEACELHGLHLRQVPAAYTSRQDSRTGTPGLRCSDVAVGDFLNSPFWRKQVLAARQKVEAGNQGSARDRYLVALDDRYLPDRGRLTQGARVRVPLKGGEVFVSAAPESGGALQADLNAAANIGLRALLDPDWEGRWWYVPCEVKTGKPLADKVKGSSLELEKQSLIAPSQDAPEKGGGKGRKKNNGQSQEIVNCWRNPSPAALLDGAGWQTTAEYWRKAEYRVITKLRREAGLPADP